MNDKKLREIIENVLSDVLSDKNDHKIHEEEKDISQEKNVEEVESCESVELDGLADISEINIRDQYLVPSPKNKDAFMSLKAKTPARLGLWRTGTRYLTEPMLRFRLDHATAQDAVFNYVDEDLIKKMNFISVSTLCEDKDEYLTRPDRGRKFNEKNIEIIEKNIEKNTKVAIIVGDGLSSQAIEANIEQILPSLKQGLDNNGLKMGKVLFIKHCRVPSMDQFAEITGAEVVCLLVGERPGLATAESMSAYMAYKPFVGMPEARRTVISNIHSGGTPAVEAGAYIADVLKKMLDEKKSGVDLY